MTDRTQFEAMLEALINEDQESAKEIFHNIVVAKSREIYEELLESDFSIAEDEDEDKEEKEEDNEEDDSRKDEMFGADDEESDDEEPTDDEEEPADDEEATDDEGDATADLLGGDDSEESSDSELEDKVMDLEDALEELKAEFEQLMADEQGEEPADMGDMGAEPEMDGAMGDMGADDELAGLMEYVNKVNPPKHGDNGANAKSVVAGKNDMGGTVANIAKGGESKSGGTQGGLLKPSTQLQNGGNINVPGGNAGKTSFKKKEPGHGAERKGSGDTAPDKKSLIGSRK